MRWPARSRESRTTATLRAFAAEAAIRPGGKCSYRVRPVGAEGWEHSEQMADRDGQVIYDVAVPVHYSMGSGTRGRSYLTSHGGVLSMSSISWYTNGNRWDLSPGYVPDDPRGFSRRVPDECLACHAGRVETIPGASGRYAAEPFPQLAIGCENCHGPGKQHVEAQNARSAAIHDTIVNPAKLPLAQRDSVCNQCHLQGEARIPRYGRTHFDFRPGQRLDETVVVFLSGTGVAGGKTEAVRHVQQMMSSRCYTASPGKLGCISCHDSHGTVSKEESQAFYRTRCLACHGESDCHAPLADRQAQQDSCFACHMPRLPAADIAHTALTDHRVLVRPLELPAASRPETHDKLLFFDNANERLPAWEATRASGLAIVKHMLDEGRTPDFAAIESLLAPVLEVAPDDTRVMNSLTEVALKQNNLEAAEKYALQAIAVDPQNEAALVALALVCYQTDRYPAGLKFSERALVLNPTLDMLYGHRADMYRLSKRLDDGILEAEKALQLNPGCCPCATGWSARIATRDKPPKARSRSRF